MSLLEALAIGLAGLAAGTINTIVGSGTLVTFPTLLFFGYAPVAANVSNSLGLVAGGVSGAWGYRHEMLGLRSTLVRLIPASLAGGIAGALLLLVLPESAFETIVPVLIALALVLVVTGPRLNRWAAARRAGGTAEATTLSAEATSTFAAGEGTSATALELGHWIALLAGVFFAGVYGGYFGAAQGVLLVGLLGVLLPLRLQQINGMKNVLSLFVNLIAALVFLVVQPEQIIWPVVALIAGGSLLGGVLGARIGRRMTPWLLRGVIVTIGIIAIVVLVS
ncbi:MAG: sulfite exporter TauE/SafE family protein [Ornithinimicrobium sp.]